MAEGRRKGPMEHKKTPKKPAGEQVHRAAQRTPVAEPIFVEYLSPAVLETGLKKSDDDEDRIWSGEIRVNSKNYREAFVTDPEGGVDILFPSLEARNRALDGDVVAFKYYPSAVFQTVEKKLSSMKISADGSKVHTDTTEFLQKRAHVVGIIEPRHTRRAIGIITQYDKATKTARLSPIDHRIPRISLPLEQCPDDLTRSFSKYKSMLFSARILDWPAVSDVANGEMINQLGVRGDLAVESAAILEFQCINDQDFAEDVVACLPDDTYTIADEDLSKRRDLRQDLCFTIDPDTARDMDDAIHCKALEDGNVEVGVHIADVTHFVKAGTPLDAEAAVRCTSTYLVERMVPMLPHQLSSDLCSLRAHEDRLAVSVVWKLSPKATILDEWMGRSVIHSRAKLSYRVAQEVLDDPEKEWTAEYLGTDEKNVRPICEALCLVSDVTKRLRERRAEKGFLAIRNNDRLSFALDDKSPIGCQPPSSYGTQRLIEELMLLANISVAGELHRRRPNTAVLRKHPAPFPLKLQEMETFARQVGLQFDCSSVQALQKSLSEIPDGAGEAGMHRLVICQKLLQAFKPAMYYTLAAAPTEGWSQPHYALNEVLYTHFTSPIRRYADVLVHRQLLAYLDGIPEVEMSEKDQLMAVVSRCNEMRMRARNAGEDSNTLYFAAFVRHAGPLVEEAVITDVLDRSVDLMLLTYPGAFRVHCNSLPLSEFTFSPDGPSLTVHWKAADGGGRDESPAAAAAARSQPGDGVMQLRLFMKVKVVVRCEERQGNPLCVAVYLQAPAGCSTEYGRPPDAHAHAVMPGKKGKGHK
ncbi:DIS3-like exonuclease 2 [Sycon ciliatum]|uniref:DIS3-like exonuclease 2 n=1 Tax=Sycon ciliatum TaxID=27933 RepID=UPI0031F68A07